MALDPSTGWGYYKQLTVSDPNNQSSNAQIKLKVYSGSGSDNAASGIVYCNNYCLNFPNDIRFGTTNNPSTATQLPQWIESYDATQAIIWVKLPSDGSDTIYMFIRNSSASMYSDGDDTFELFDHFTSTLVDMDKWSDAQNVTVNNSEITITGTTSSNGYLKSAQTFGTGYAVRVRAKCTNLATYGSSTVGFGTSYLDNDCATADQYGSSTYIRLITKQSGNTTTTDTSVPKQLNTYFIFNLWRPSRTATVTLYINDGNSTSSSSNISTANISVRLFSRGGSVSYQTTTVVDWVAVYKVTSISWSSFGSWVSLVGQAYQITLSDSTTLGDWLSKNAGISRRDALTISDSKLLGVGITRRDNLTLSDRRQLGICIIRVDSLTLTDAKYINPRIARGEILSLYDIIEIIASLSKSQSINAILEQAKVKLHDIDSILLKTIVSSIPVDALLFGTNEYPYRFNSIISKLLSLSASIDVIASLLNVKKEQLIDTIVLAIKSNNINIDAISSKLNIPKSLIIDALISTSNMLGYDFDAITEKSLTDDFLLNILISSAKSIDIDIGVIISKTRENSFSFNAMVRRLENEIGMNINAIIKTMFEAEASIDTILEALTIIKYLFANTILQKELASNYNYDAISSMLNISIDSLVNTIAEKTGLERSYVYDTLIRSYAGKSFIIDTIAEKTGIERDKIIDAVVSASVSKSSIFDVLVEITRTDSRYIFDILTQKANELNINIDSILHGTSSSDLIFDILIAEKLGAVYPLDTILKILNVPIDMALDTIVMNFNIPLSLAFDILISSAQIKHVDIDVVLKGIVTKELLNGVILKAMEKREIFIDSLLKAYGIEAHQFIDMVAKLSNIPSQYLFDATMLISSSADYPIDTVIRKLNIINHAIDALLAEVKRLNIDLDTLLIKANLLKAFIISCVVVNRNVERSLILDTIVKAISSINYLVNLILECSVEKNMLANMLASALGKTKYMQFDIVSAITNIASLVLFASIGYGTEKLYSIDAMLHGTAISPLNISTSIFQFIFIDRVISAIENAINVRCDTCKALGIHPVTEPVFNVTTNYIAA